MNFCLKRKDVSNDRRDRSLSSGWSYFVQNESYKEHLARYKGESEVVNLVDSPLPLEQRVDFVAEK